MRKSKCKKKTSGWNQTTTSKALLFSMILTAMSGQIVNAIDKNVIKMYLTASSLMMKQQPVVHTPQV